MSAALRLTTASPPTPTREAGPDPMTWITLNDAAAKLGRNADALGRECRGKLIRLGLAKKATPEGGGAAQWFVCRRFDPRLMAGRAGDKHRLPDLDRYSKRQVDTAFRRVQCVESLREARASWPGNQQDWMPLLVKQLQAEHPGLSISASSLYRWYRDYQSPADLAKLIDTRGGNRVGEADPACWDAFRALYLDQNRPSVSSCWRQVDDYAQREGLRWLTLSACRYQLDKRIPPEQAAQCREPKTYRDKFSPFIEYDPNAYDAGERWDGDNCVLDLMCWWGEGEQRKIIRPWVTAWIDWRTRKIVGWQLSDAPNSQTILSAFRSAMLDPSNHGGPRVVWIDNGKDFDSYVFHGRTKRDRRQEQRERALRKDKFIKREMGRLAKIDGGVQVDEGLVRSGVFNLLDIEAHFAIPYNSRGKARIERWFGTLHALFDKRFKTYCGATTDQKPEDLEKLLRKQPHNIPTFETVKSELAAFIAEYNATVKNRKGAEGLSPDQAMVTLPHTVRETRHPEALRQCLAMWHRPVKVTRNGVRLTIGTVSYNYGQYDPALTRLKGTGKHVHVSYDPEDMSTVEIYDDKHVHLCTATENRRVGRADTKLTHKQVQRNKTERSKRVKQREALNKTALGDIVSEHFLIGASAEPITIDLDLLTRAAKRQAREVPLKPKREPFTLDPIDMSDFNRRVMARDKAMRMANGGDRFDLLRANAARVDEDEDNTDIILLATKGGAA